MVEWYDFTIYGYLAVVIAPLFFPSEDRSSLAHGDLRGLRGGVRDAPHRRASLRQPSATGSGAATPSQPSSS